MFLDLKLVVCRHLAILLFILLRIEFFSAIPNSLSYFLQTLLHFHWKTLIMWADYFFTESFFFSFVKLITWMKLQHSFIKNNWYTIRYHLHRSSPRLFSEKDCTQRLLESLSRLTLVDKKDSEFNCQMLNSKNPHRWTADHERKSNFAISLISFTRNGDVFI